MVGNTSAVLYAGWSRRTGAPAAGMLLSKPALLLPSLFPCVCLSRACRVSNLVISTERHPRRAKFGSRDKEGPDSGTYPLLFAVSISPAMCQCASATRRDIQGICRTRGRRPQRKGAAVGAHTGRSRCTSPCRRHCGGGIVCSSAQPPGMGRSTRCTLCYGRRLSVRWPRKSRGGGRNSALLELVGGRAGPSRSSLVWSLRTHRDLCRRAGGAVTCRSLCTGLGRDGRWATLVEAASAAEVQHPCVSYRYRT